jgi:hypothetical protein
MAKDQKSKAGWLDRRREKKRERQLRTGDSPEKIAEQARKGGPPDEPISALEALGDTRNAWQRAYGAKPRDFER